jgi:hypothetical protein
MVVSALTPRCLQLNAAVGGPAAAPAAWYALSAARPLVLARGALTLRSQPADAGCPAPFGSYAMAGACRRGRRRHSAAALAGWRWAAS